MNHLKRLLAFFMIGCFILLPKAAQAAETNIPDGLLIGDDNGITVSKSGNYFFNLEDLLPGDTITRNLIIKNARNKDYSLKMVIEAVSTEGTINFLEEMTMKFQLNSHTIFDGNLVNDDGTTGKKEIDFGVVKAGSTQTLAIDLKVNPTIPWDKFKKGESKAVTRWTFIAQRAQEGSSDSSSDVSETNKPTGKKPVGIFPSTGDKPSNLLFLASGVMMIITAVLFFVLNRKERKSTSQNNQ